MADTLAARVTGATGPSDGPVMPVAVNLVLSDVGLLTGADDARPRTGELLATAGPGCSVLACAV